MAIEVVDYTPTGDVNTVMSAINVGGNAHLTIPVTCSGTGRLLITYLVAPYDPYAAAFYDDVQMQPVWVRSSGVSNAGEAACFIKTDPTEGTNDTDIYLGSADAGYLVQANSISLSGVNTSAPIGPIAFNTGSGTSASLTIPLQPGEKAFALIMFTIDGSVTCTPGGSQTELVNASTISGSFEGRQSITISEVENNTWTGSTACGWYAIGFAIRPAGSVATPPMPMLEAFTTRLESGTPTYITAIDDAYAQYLIDGGWEVVGDGPVASAFYDGPKALLETADFLGSGHALYDDCIAAAMDQFEILHDGRYIASCDPDYSEFGYSVFTEGPLALYVDHASADGYATVEGLRDHSAFSADSAFVTPAEDYPTGSYDRELAYIFLAHISAVRAGGITPRTAKMESLFERALTYVEYWVNDDWEGSAFEIKPFFMGVMGKTLIRYYTYIDQDARIITALDGLCAYLWTNAWQGGGFQYNINPDSDNYPGPGGSLLNNLIGPMFAWVGWKTGNIERIRQFELMFGQDLVNRTKFYVGKEWNQQHVLAFDGMEWRDEFYAATPVRRSGRLRRTVA